MKYWTYEELVTCIKNNFQSQIDQGLPVLQAIGVVSSDFWFYPENECIVENLIDITQTLHLCINHIGYVNEESIAVYHRQLNLLSDELLKAQLTDDEVVLLGQSIEDLNERLKSVEIERDYR
jgi:hypothetical protein